MSNRRQSQARSKNPENVRDTVDLTGAVARQRVYGGAGVVVTVDLVGRCACCGRAVFSTEPDCYADPRGMLAGQTALVDDDDVTYCFECANSPPRMRNGGADGDANWDVDVELFGEDMVAVRVGGRYLIHVVNIGPEGGTATVTVFAGTDERAEAIWRRAVHHTAQRC